MEAAPLALAHAHARKASQESNKASLTVAASEHEAAAGQFAKAAEDTHDSEALRILRLLEEHHHRLADIIKTKDTISAHLPDPTEPHVPTQESKQSLASALSPAANALDGSPQTQRGSGSTLAKIHQQRRDSSPALAKDIASRRGIPQPQQRRLHVPAEGKTNFAHSTDPSNPRTKHISRARQHDPVQESTLNAATPPMESTQRKQSGAGDDGFSRFYSTLTSGPFSRLSSILSFAALPLTDTLSQPSSPTSSRTERTSVRAHNEPDLRTLVSPAALNALEEQQRRHGIGGQAFGPGESFYVVPPSGGTASYANIMRTEQRYARRQQGHLSHISEEDNEFVDARETQAPKTGGVGMGANIDSHEKVGGGGATQGHRVEELELENDTLKHALDQMSHRLQAFERSAQDASMAALTQSMVSVRTQGGGVGAARHEEALGHERDRTMEEEMQRAAQEIAELKRQNRKYQAYYDKLEASARKKEREKKEKSTRA
ncbi:hypothetical protein AAFC00_000270 [Neodothiora populina]|uniref:Uncharacterized protein n=1 Tax=Neodothiora populina TaxID=2781224 RepID=A0ABR3PCC2_9PEZI